MQSKYLPCGAAAIHLLCRVEQRQELIFTTRELVESRYSKEANQAPTHWFVEALSPQARSVRGASLEALETSPYVLWILSAGDGSIFLDRIASSLNLLGQKEQIAFDDHVSVLRSLGLTYVVAEDDDETMKWSKTASTQTKVLLEPPLDCFTIFEQLEESRRRDIPAAVRLPSAKFFQSCFRLLNIATLLTDERTPGSKGSS